MFHSWTLFNIHERNIAIATQTLSTSGRENIFQCFLKEVDNYSVSISENIIEKQNYRSIFLMKIDFIFLTKY